MPDGAQPKVPPPFGASVIAAIPNSGSQARGGLVYVVSGTEKVTVHREVTVNPVSVDVTLPEPLGALQDVGSPGEHATVEAEPLAGPLALTVDIRDRIGLDAALTAMDESTPLAMEVAADTRRRIALSGRRFPRPPSTRVLTVANQKGGVGKTTTTVNLAAALAQSGLRVLVLDIDPQGNASTALGVPHHSEVPSVYDVLVDGRKLAEVIQLCPDIQGLTCAPATIDLAGAEIELVSLVARESRLQRAVQNYLSESDPATRPDYLLVDCPPSLGLLTVNAFVAASEVLIPIQCEYYALEGLSQLLRNVELIRGHLNPDLFVSTILLTMYDGRTRLSAQVADEVRSHFPAEVLKTTVPRSVRISEAPSHGQTVMTYDPTSSGALSYLEAARELAEQVLGLADAEPGSVSGTKGN
jgi:chromosome partitioning protein